MPDPAARPPLDASRLDAAAPGVPAGVRIEVLDEVDSTNAEVARRARAGAPHGLVVLAEHQRAGRGRLDRAWVSAPGVALTFSLLLRPTAPAASWPWIPLLTGLALGRVLRARGLDAGVKWPNDVLVGERKISGILVERVETSTGAAAVVGVGLNVAHTVAELPVATATSVALEAGGPVDRTDLLVELLAELDATFTAWQDRAGTTGPDELVAAYTDACVTLGRGVRVELPGTRDLLGRATTIDAAGRLVVVDAEGQAHAVSAGDVVHVRPAPTTPGSVG